MQELISRLAFPIMFITINCYLGVAATDAFSSPAAALGAINQNFDRLNGAHLKFAVAHVPPSNVLTKGPDGNYTHTGISALFIDWLAEKLNFTFAYLFIPNNTLGAKYENMSEFAIIFSLLNNKEVDGSAVPAIATPKRKQLYDFAYFMFSDPHAIVVWLCILLAMVVMVCLLTVLSTIYSRFMPSTKFFKTNEPKRSIWQTAGCYAIYVINIITNQGGSVPGSRFSFRVLMGAWLLAAMVLVNSYSGTVVSYLTAPKMMPSINTLEDLAASQDVGVIVLDNAVFAQDAMEATSGTLKILADQVRHHPDRLLNNIPKGITLLETGHYALPFLQTFCNDFVAKHFKKEGNCRFKTTDPITSSAFFSLLLPKNSKLTSEFYLAQIKAWEMGLPPYWMKISIQQAPKCFNKKRSEAAKKKPIGMDDLFGAFLILSVGLGLATIAIFMENFISCFQRKALAVRNG
ncbi:hypothetical protein DAPPUDRAFT_320132 [Daphnia pulex]|uniref:Ionotropic glutamate receptor C-terminal domain-containing protein n=1 Tax=Daphnia pulex TaxID=6669 RepID=E9GNY1_DAPPU|nr:hypothetical protein DAPPUDRAFT_320132 [Daphnia pulex]|eukprot:EFX78830.1 hypothetical protein DAPPUDRAFT_320132 [Daphnia pulex]